jgi:hypothetical protein
MPVSGNFRNMHLSPAPYGRSRSQATEKNEKQGGRSALTELTEFTEKYGFLRRWSIDTGNASIETAGINSLFRFLLLIPSCLSQKTVWSIPVSGMDQTAFLCILCISAGNELPSSPLCTL